MDTESHPTDLTLKHFLLGKLPDDECVALKEHIESCPDCLNRLEHNNDTVVPLVRAEAQRGGGDVFHETEQEEKSTQGAGEVILERMGAPPLAVGFVGNTLI